MPKLISNKKLLNDVLNFCAENYLTNCRDIALKFDISYFSAHKYLEALQRRNLISKFRLCLTGKKFYVVYLVKTPDLIKWELRKKYSNQKQED